MQRTLAHSTVILDIFECNCQTNELVSIFLLIQCNRTCSVWTAVYRFIQLLVRIAKIGRVQQPSSQSICSTIAVVFQGYQQAIIQFKKQDGAKKALALGYQSGCALYGADDKLTATTAGTN